MCIQSKPLDEPIDIISAKGDDIFMSIEHYFHKNYDSRYRFKERFKESIMKYWQIGSLENGVIRIDEKDYNVIIMTFINDLIKNNFKKLYDLQNDSNGEVSHFAQYIQDTFLNYLRIGKKFKEERKKLYNLLKEAEKLPHEKKKERLNKFFTNNESTIDDEIDKKLKSLTDEYQFVKTNEEKYKEFFDKEIFKKKVKGALCVHPEKILEAYDFTKSLKRWYRTTVKRAISLIYDIMLVDMLLEHDEYFIEKIFDSKESKYRSAIDNIIRDEWDLNDDDESIDAVIDTYLYYLLYKHNGKNIQSFKSNMVRRVPYVLLKIDSDKYYRQDEKTPKTWERFDIWTDLNSQIEESSRYYAIECKAYKDERNILNDLLYTFNKKERTNYLWLKQKDKYKSEIREIHIDLKENYRCVEGIDEIINVENEMEQLRIFLCDDYKKILEKYDFSMPFNKWIKERASLFYKNHPKKEILIKDKSNDSINIFIEEMHKRLENLVKRFRKDIPLTNYVDGYSDEKSKQSRELLIDVDTFKTNLVNKIIEDKDQFIKLLEDYNYDGDLLNYFSSTYYHELSKMAKEEKKIEKSKQKKNKGSDIITRKQKVATLGKLINLIKESEEIRKFFGINEKTKALDQLDYIEQLFVNLKNFTSAEQRSIRKRLIEERNNKHISTYTYRGKNILISVLAKYTSLRLKDEANCTEEEIKILSTLKNTISESIIEDLLEIDDFLKLKGKVSNKLKETGDKKIKEKIGRKIITQ